MTNIRERRWRAVAFHLGWVFPLRRQEQETGQ